VTRIDSNKVSTNFMGPPSSGQAGRNLASSTRAGKDSGPTVVRSGFLGIGQHAKLPKTKQLAAMEAWKVNGGF
jgi:hypothetical protein